MKLHHVVDGPAGAPALVLSSSLGTTFEMWEPQVGPIADAVLGRWFEPAFRDTHPDVVARFRAMLVSTPAKGYAACCDVLADADLTARLAEIAAPTLVLTGAADLVVPPATGVALAAAIPGAAHTVIEGAAHIANVEQPDAFTAALLRHLGAGRRDA